MNNHVGLAPTAKNGAVDANREDEVEEYLPQYLRQPRQWNCTITKRFFLKLAQTVLRMLAVIALRPRCGPVGNLDIKEVEEVYRREAPSYDRKHHLTTRGMDTAWRRTAAWFVAILARNNGMYVTVLDLCTGTGLAVVEMVSLLSLWRIRGSITGLDYSENMLAQARRRAPSSPGIDINFVRGNAMNLVQNSQPALNSLTCFQSGAFDAVTQVFGLGGIQKPLCLFSGVLEILKPGGQYFLCDMHQPIPEQPGEWPFLWRWFKSPLFEAVTYNESTLPLVLNRLWAWRDTTLDFYLLPIITMADENGDHWGFKTVYFNVESERWWLGLPIMPVAKMIVEKTAITNEEADRRQRILATLKQQRFF